MKQLIILLLLPSFAFSQPKGVVPKQKADTAGNWVIVEPDYKPSGTRKTENIHNPARLTMHHEYQISVGTRDLFRAACYKDTLYINPSQFDSIAVKAKVIIVAGKTFQLKENNK